MGRSNIGKIFKLFFCMVKKGYSLAETLIVIALIMIMAGLFLNSDLPRRKLTIQREAYILSQNIRTMENNAGNARSHTNCNIENPNSPNPEGGLYPFGGYAAMLDIDKPNQYFLYTNCNEDGPYTLCEGEYDSDLKVGDCVRISDVDYNKEGSLLLNAAASTNCPANTASCDFYYDNRGKDGYINELMQKRIFPTSIRFDKIEALIRFENQWKWQECSQMIIDFKPTNPDTFIICAIKGKSTFYYVAKEAKISITDGENVRYIEINKAGLVAVKSDAQ